jgi:IS30 family transposase
MARQLTMEEREVLSQMRYAGASNAEIARTLGRHRSTIGRELKRNSSGDRYFATTAHGLAQTRRHCRWAGRRKMEQNEIVRFVQRGLKRFWSPDQIAGRSHREYRSDGSRHIGRQTIYNWIRQQGQRGDDTWKTHLRFANKRRRYRSNSTMATRSIAGRPAVVDRRSRYGDWEGDTMVGAGHRGALVTSVERKSGYLLASRVRDRQARRVNQSLYGQFRRLPPTLRRTMTFDRGKEFSEHEALAEKTQLEIYFADPYCSWQRGTNENTNGLLRQFFPKGTDFTQITAEQLARAKRLINDRPRKRLNYRTPREVLGPYLNSCN